jgi:hypothetical protein
VREVSGHLSVKIRGIDVVSLSTSPAIDTGTCRKIGNIDTSNFNRQVTTHFSHLTQALVEREATLIPLTLTDKREVSGHLSVKVRGINVASLSTSACVK